ncbi:MAG: helicase-related protein, partial [Vicinamibacteria bacterium]
MGLIRSGLLKRFESSVHAFAETVGRMAIAHEAFLKGLEQGLIASPQALVEWQEVDSDVAWDEVLREADSEDAAGYDVTRLKGDLQADLELLRRFEKRARRVGRADDPKLMALADALAEIALRAEHDAINEEDAREKRKVLIFTYYGDTVDWIEEFLLDAVEHDSRLAAFKGRIASVAGSASRGGVTREAAIYGFAPRSTEAPVGRDENRFDVLITTDILAEGMNLQQCRNIINFDLPWNPMRLVQRHGRIDRIGSPHSRVFVRCFFPDRQLDALLDLELRVRHKLAQAAASIGLEVEVIPGAETIDRNFAETREEIEKIRRENPAILETAGEDVNAHSGEEYRQELRKGLIERRDEIELLPWGAGSG